MRASAEGAGRGSGVKGGGERVSFRGAEDKLDEWSRKLDPVLDVLCGVMSIFGKSMVILVSCGLLILAILVLGCAVYYIGSALLRGFF